MKRPSSVSAGRTSQLATNYRRRLARGLPSRAHAPVRNSRSPAAGGTPRIGRHPGPSHPVRSPRAHEAAELRLGRPNLAARTDLPTKARTPPQPPGLWPCQFRALWMACGNGKDEYGPEAYRDRGWQGGMAGRRNISAAKGRQPNSPTMPRLVSSPGGASPFSKDRAPPNIQGTWSGAPPSPRGARGATRHKRAWEGASPSPPWGWEGDRGDVGGIRSAAPFPPWGWEGDRGDVGGIRSAAPFPPWGWEADRGDVGGIRSTAPFPPWGWEGDRGDVGGDRGDPIYPRSSERICSRAWIRSSFSTSLWRKVRLSV